MLFMLTGLPERKARFQVISILTNTGFTTGESEVITSSRRRRRLASRMMFSAASNPLLVFAIKRAGETRHDVGPTDVLQTGDRIVLFGSLESVHALFRLKPSFSRDQEEEET